MFEFVKQYGEFYPLSSTIELIEKKMEIIFPKELKEFYKEIGYGRIFSKGTHAEDTNAILNPNAISRFRLREGEWSYIQLEDYQEYEDKGRLCFFSVHEDAFMFIQVNDEETSPVYYEDVKIADSLVEFLTKYIENDTYYRNMATEYYADTLEEIKKLKRGE